MPDEKPTNPGDPLVKEELRARSVELGWCSVHEGYHRNYRCEHGHGADTEACAI